MLVNDNKCIYIPSNTNLQFRSIYRKTIHAKKSGISITSSSFHPMLTWSTCTFFFQRHLPKRTTPWNRCQTRCLNGGLIAICVSEANQWTIISTKIVFWWRRACWKGFKKGRNKRTLWIYIMPAKVFGTCQPSKLIAFQQTADSAIVSLTTIVSHHNRLVPYVNRKDTCQPFVLWKTSGKPPHLTVVASRVKKTWDPDGTNSNFWGSEYEGWHSPLDSHMIIIDNIHWYTHAALTWKWLTIIQHPNAVDRLSWKAMLDPFAGYIPSLDALF